MCEDHGSATDERTGTSYQSLAGSVRDQGERIVSVFTRRIQDNDKFDWDTRVTQMAFRVCPIGKPVLSVSQITDMDNTVVFRNGGSFIHDNRTGRVTPLVRRRGIYEIDCKVQSHDSWKRVSTTDETMESI